MPLRDALKILIHQKNMEAVETQQKAKALLKKEVYAYPKEIETKISIISDDCITQYITDANKRLQQEWLWFTQIERIPTVVTTHYESWKQAAARGIQWRIIAELNEPTNQTLRFIHRYKKENPNFVVRFTEPTLLVTFALRDDKELDFFTEIPRSQTGSRALYTNNPQLVKVIKDYFELRWDTAMEKYPKKYK